MDRRNFLKAIATGSLAGPAAFTMRHGIAYAKAAVDPGPKLKLSLNAYSFNSLLRSGDMDLDGLLDFCARYDFDAVDLTGYYFPGYPEVPEDTYINHIKRKAFLLGLDISGTGVRNDFTDPDAQKREADIALIKSWIEAAARLGAPLIRVFTGHGVPDGYTEEEITSQVVEALKVCAEYGARFGVIVAIQNHADLIQRADQLLGILDRVNSEWLGVVLDIGSFRTEDPYRDIARAAPYASSWQIKEKLTIGGEEVKTDLSRIVQILREANYRGYIPLETLGEGDPREKVPRFLSEVREALAVS